MIMTDILKAEEDELTRRLEAVRHVLHAYHADEPVVTSPEPLPPNYKAQVLQVAREVVRSATHKPVPTHEIVKAVKEAGITIRGQREMNAISAMLSKAKDFKPNGRTGWTLR